MSKKTVQAVDLSRPVSPTGAEPLGCPRELAEHLTHALDVAKERTAHGEALYQEYGPDAGFAIWGPWVAKGAGYAGPEAARAEFEAFANSISVHRTPKLLRYSFNRLRNRSSTAGTYDRLLDWPPTTAAELAAERVRAGAVVAELRASAQPSKGRLYQFPTPEARAAETRAAPAVVVQQSPLDWANLAGNEPPPRKWVLPHWIPDGHTTLLAGRGGIGKTLLGQHLASAAALGRTYIEPMEARKVLFWAGEDDTAELWRRQRPICEFLGATLSDLVGKLFLYSYAGHDVTLMANVYGELKPTPMLEELRSQVHDYGAQLVLLDNIARLFGGNENDRHAATTFCAVVQGVCAPAAVLLLGHPAKGAGSEYSGSTAWEGAVRARLYLGDEPPDSTAAPVEGNDRALYLSRRKANYAPEDVRRFRLEDGVLMPDAAPAKVRKPDAIEARAIVRAALAELTRRDMNASPKKGANYLPALAEESGLLGGLRKEAFAAAMQGMLNDGELVIGTVGKYGNGAAKRGLTESKA
jgi:hypothetical protein